MNDLSKYPLPGQPHPHRGHSQFNTSQVQSHNVSAPIAGKHPGIQPISTVQGNAVQHTPNHSQAHSHNGMVHHAATHHATPTHHGGHHGGRKKK